MKWFNGFTISFFFYFLLCADIFFSRKNGSIEISGKKIGLICVFGKLKFKILSNFKNNQEKNKNIFKIYNY